MSSDQKTFGARMPPPLPGEIGFVLGQLHNTLCRDGQPLWTPDPPFGSDETGRVWSIGATFGPVAMMFYGVPFGGPGSDWELRCTFIDRTSSVWSPISEHIVGSAMSRIHALQSELYPTPAAAPSGSRYWLQIPGMWQFGVQFDE